MSERFNIISLDIPWDYPRRNNAATRFGQGMSRYAGMKRPDILALPVADLAADNCALFFWVTAPKIRSNYIPLKIMFECFEAWGFDYKSKAFTWVKVSKDGKARKLPGYYGASNTEDCYLAMRGKLQVFTKMVPQVIFATIGAHSRKPPEALARMVRMFGPWPRVELFATVQRPGWHSWGKALTGDQTMKEHFKL